MAPPGALAITWLLRLAAGDGWQWWRSIESLEGMGQVVPLGAAIYGSVIAILEGVVRMFWALAQIAKDIDQWRSEGREQGLQEGLERGRMEGREEGREEGRQEGREEGRQEGKEEGREAGREEYREEVIRLLEARNIELPEELLRNGNGQAGESG